MMWMTRALITAHGLTKPTPVLPECSSLPTETKENHCRLFSGKFRQVSGAKKKIITGTKQLKMTALTVRNTGAPQQSKHQEASCSSQEYSRALLTVWTAFLTLHLKVSEWDSITFHWAQLPKGSASCLPSISFPLRNICTREGCNSNNALGEDTTQQAPEGLEHLLEVSKRSKVLNSAVIHPEMDYTPPIRDRFTHTALP